MTNTVQFALMHGASILFAWILAQQAGAPIPSAPVLIAVESFASSKRLGLASSLIATFSACLLANGFWSRVGRQGWSDSHGLCRTSGKWQGRALRVMRAHSAATLLLAKFIAGSNLASLLAGKAGVPAARFLAYEGIGSLTWSGSYMAVGYLFHDQLPWKLEQTLHSLLAARAAVFFATSWRRRLRARVAILAPAILFFYTVRQLRQSKAGPRPTTAFTSPQLTNKSSRFTERSRRPFTRSCWEAKK